MEAAAIRHVHLVAHAQIDHLFTSLLDAAAARDAAVRDAFRSLRDEVTAHIASEEQHALPAYAKAFPEEAARIDAEHDDIRVKLADIDEALENDTFTSRLATELRVAFSLHEAREETTMYPWFAEQTAPAPAGT